MDVKTLIVTDPAHQPKMWLCTGAFPTVLLRLLQSSSMNLSLSESAHCHDTDECATALFSRIFRHESPVASVDSYLVELRIT